METYIKNLKDVLEWVMETEGEHYDEVVAEYGEDSFEANAHVWSKASSAYVDYGFDETE